MKVSNEVKVRGAVRRAVKKIKKEFDVIQSGDFMIKRFFLFDDNPSINALNKMIILKVIKDAEVTGFDEPEKALEYITSNYKEIFKDKIVFFLDINMPGMNSWEFLRELEKIDPKILKNISIYILSAYITLEDRKKIEDALDTNKIKGSFQKPLTGEIIEKVSSN